MTRDVRLLFATRSVRMFGYGSLAVVLVLYLAAVGLDGAQIGLLLALTLLGDTLVSLWLTTRADRFGRRRTLVVGALLMAGAGVVFAWAGALPAGVERFAVLVVAATIGVLSPSGNEVGPFLAVEQAGLSQVIDDRRRTAVFARYNLAGSVATAFGALTTGVAIGALLASGMATLDAYRVVLLAYAVLAIVLVPLVRAVSPAVELPARQAGPDEGLAADVARRFGLHRSRGIVLRLSLLFSLDAFAGGFVMQSLIAYWFHVRFGVPEVTIGVILFGANLLAAASALAAARIAARIGLVNTMVFTHLPSNVLLLLVPLMPTLPLAAAVLLGRFAISQMDVPTRQSYTMAVVDPDERSAAAGVTGIARTTGASISPLLAAPLIAVPALAAVPFLIAGGLKIVYDLLLWRAFRARPAPEEAPR